jgi:hypothetical protein
VKLKNDSIEEMIFCKNFVNRERYLLQKCGKLKRLFVAELFPWILKCSYLMRGYIFPEICN